MHLKFQDQASVWEFMGLAQSSELPLPVIMAGEKGTETALRSMAAPMVEIRFSTHWNCRPISGEEQIW